MKTIKRSFKLRTVLHFLICVMVTAGLSIPAMANNFVGVFDDRTEAASDEDGPNVLDELNPFAPDIEQQLERLDQEYRNATDKSPWLDGTGPGAQMAPGNTCYRSSCKVYIRVRKSEQRMYVYVNGNPFAEYLVSSGAPGHETPNFDKHPNGRIYDKYSSRTYPGGDYKGLGNMPYAVFIQGGFALHGTTKGNFKYLGRKASHGCIRLHPDNAFVINRLVREHGIYNTWIQID